MQNFQLFSRRLHFLFQSLLIVFPFLTVVYWLNVEYALSLHINPFFIPQEHIELNGVSKSLGFILSLLSAFMTIMMCFYLCRLFKNYEKGDVLTEENAFYYQKLGKMLFVFSAVQWGLPALMGIALTFQNPPGERLLTFSLGTAQLLPFIIGFVITGIAHVMKEAYRLEKEQQLTI